MHSGGHHAAAAADDVDDALDAQSGLSECTSKVSSNGTEAGLVTSSHAQPGDQLNGLNSTSSSLTCTFWRDIVT